MLSRTWGRVGKLPTSGLFPTKRRQVTVLVVLALALASAGCIQIQVIDRTPQSTDLVTEAESDEVEEHDLAVLAVDFDPPLEYDEIMAQRDRGEGITLLVAVENTGSSAEHDVTVEVRLSKIEDRDQVVLLRKEGTISEIAPGEIKIVHFKDTDIPFSYRYSLWVHVVPVSGETRQSDNEKSYELLITQP